MVVLPVVDRELRVAARKPSTFRVRWVGVLVTLVIAIGLLILAGIGGAPFPTATLGRALFGVLTWLALAACLSAGLFFTSDCLSEEKRQGTIGFLFLTDLKGHDVVLGKLLATSLRGVCMMLGVFPVLSVTLVMGGVTGAQYWKTCLALLSALFLSLAAGLFVSSISRLSQRAMVATVLLLLLLLAGGPAVDAVLAFLTSISAEPRVSLSSPVVLFLTASQRGAESAFWVSALTNQLVVWTLLGVTFWILPRTWQERSKAGATARQSRPRRLRLGSTRQRDRRLLEVNPVLWLACREHWQSILLWMAALTAVAGLCLVGGLSSAPVVWSVWSTVTGLVVLVLYLGIASQVGRFFVEARQNGFMELLLITPVTPDQVVAGQWRSLLRLFAIPLAIFLVCRAVSDVRAQYETWTTLSSAAMTMPVRTPATTNAIVGATNASPATAQPVASAAPVALGLGDIELWLIVLVGVFGTVVVAANLAALAWFGMWMGLTSKNVNLATLKTLLFVQVIPWFVISFAAGLSTVFLVFPTMINTGSGGTPFVTMMWYPLVAGGVTLTLGLIKNVGFVMYARRRLLTQFRERAARSFDHTLPPLPPVVRPPEPATPAA